MNEKITILLTNAIFGGFIGVIVFFVVYGVNYYTLQLPYDSLQIMGTFSVGVGVVFGFMMGTTHPKIAG